MKLKVGDTVLHSHSGVCKITDIVTQTFNREERDYYVLLPLFDKRSTCYVPVDYNPEKIHIQPVLTTIQAQELLENAKNASPLDWINNPNERKQKFKSVCNSGSREEKMRLIKAIRKHEEEQKKMGKQLYAADLHIVENCENGLLGELSYVLNIPVEELKNCI